MKKLNKLTLLAALLCFVATLTNTASAQPSLSAIQKKYCEVNEIPEADCDAQIRKDCGTEGAMSDAMKKSSLCTAKAPATAPKADADAAADATEDTDAEGDKTEEAPEPPSVLFPVKTWPELIELLLFVDRYTKLELDKGFVPDARARAEQLAADNPELLKRLMLLWTSFTESLEMAGKTLPPSKMQAIMAYLNAKGCTGEPNAEWTGCDALLAQVLAEVKKYLAAAKPGEFTNNANDLVKAIEETFAGGDAIILYHGVLAGITSQLDEGKRPWNLTDGDCDGDCTGAHSIEGFHISPELEYIAVLATGQTPVHLMRVHFGAGYTVPEFPFTFRASVFLEGSPGGGIADHYSELATDGDRVDGGVRVSAGYRAPLADGFNLAILAAGGVTLRGGGFFLPSVTAEIYATEVDVITAGVSGGYVDMARPLGGNLGIDTHDPRSEGGAIGGGVGYVRQF